MTVCALSDSDIAYIHAHCDDVSGREIAERLNVSRTSVHRYIRNHIKGNRARPASVKTQNNMAYVSENWLAMSDETMAAHLDVTPETVRKYRLDLGFKRPMHNIQLCSIVRDQTRAIRTTDNRLTDTTVKAADYLASFDRTPVFRIDETGKPSAKGQLWRYGTARLTTEQMMAKAYRKGFDPDAWRRLAA